MSQQGVVHRYALIIEKIKEGFHPSKQDLRQFLDDNGFEISERTLDRHIEQIRNEFGIEIAYDRTRNGYYINEEHSKNYDGFVRFLELSTTANAFELGMSVSEHISFESERGFKGIRNLRDLMEAVRKDRMVKIMHQRFNSELVKEYTLKPYLLKEFRNRWYCYAWVEEYEEFRTFGLDRIIRLDILANSFKREKGIDPRDHYMHVIGLSNDGSKPQWIKLRATKNQAPYLLSLPIHHSQEVINEAEEHTDFQYYLVPNYEFYQQVLLYGTEVKLLEPKALVKKFKSVAKRIYEQYH